MRSEKLDFIKKTDFHTFCLNIPLIGTKMPSYNFPARFKPQI